MAIILNQNFMKKTIFALILLTLFTGCSLNNQATNNTNSGQDARFAVYLVDSKQMVFSDEDIELYDAATHTFTFTKDGAEKMKSYQSSLQIDTGLYQKSFIAKLGDEEIYSGKFWTGLSSLSESGIVMTDVAMVGPTYNTLTVASSYPSEEISPENKTTIDDARMIEHFRTINKLK